MRHTQVDAAFVYRDPKDRRSSHVTFSGLLNALDGVAAGEERILFMTTNHIERLDPALIRPGRVDVIHEVGNASASQSKRMFLKFFPKETALAERFVEVVGDTQLSMALLQSFFMLYRHSAAEACEGAAELCAGANAVREGVPAQQHMVQQQLMQQHALQSSQQQTVAGTTTTAEAVEAEPSSSPPDTNQ